MGIWLFDPFAAHIPTLYTVWSYVVYALAVYTTCGQQRKKVVPSYRKNYTLYPRKLKAGTIWYYRTYAPDGTRTTGKSTGQTSKTKADLYCQQLYREGILYSGKSVVFRAYAHNWFVWGKCAYLKDRLASGTESRQAITERYAKTLHTALRIHILPYFEKYKLEAITPAKIKAWRVQLKEKGLSNKTINNIAGALKIMTDWALNENIIQYDPFRSVKALLTDDYTREAFTLDEGIRILSNEWPSYLAWLYNFIAAVTGMRQAEIRAIRKEIIAPEYLNVTHQYIDSLVPVKNKEVRKVPINKTVYNLLMKEPGEYIFQLPREKHPLSRHYVVYRLDQAMPEDIRAQKEKRKLCFHSWRHFFNSYLRSENVSDAKIMSIMGHSQGRGSMTDIYTSWTPEMYPEIYTAQEKLISLILKSNQNV
jgi:integrase